MLGILYAVQGDKTSAVKYYKSYLQLAPGAKDAETVRTVIKRLEAIPEPGPSPNRCSPGWG